MITAHLPAGYLTARALNAKSGLVLGAALLGSVLPDFDMIWFYLIDNRAIHHHRYWVHAPGFWAMVATIALPVLYFLRPPAFRAGIAFFAAIFVHLILDSLAGSIMWLWPFDTTLYVLVEVPATQNHWVLSFILHWTFLAELAIWAAAIYLWIRRKA